MPRTLTTTRAFPHSPGFSYANSHATTLCSLLCVSLLVFAMVSGMTVPVFAQSDSDAKQDSTEQTKASSETKKKLEGESPKQDQESSKQDQESEKQNQDSSKQSVELPWERKRENRIPRITLLNERELLADVSAEEILKIQDHVPLNQTSQHLFAKLLFRVPQFGLDNLKRLADTNSKIGLDLLESESGFHRLKVIRVEGRARHWEKRKLVPEIGELFDLANYYKVKIQTPEKKNVILYCLEIPDAWKENPTINEAAHFEGVYLNWTHSKEKEPIFNFIATRARWTPKNNSNLVTSKGHALLGSAGFDLGLLDSLETRNKKRLDDEDIETFYQMLAAANLVANSRNAPNWQKEVPRFDLIETLRSPEKQHGSLSIVSVEVRNITRIQLKEDYIRKRIGIDQYFQLDGFVKFDSSVTYKGKDGEKGAVFKDKYPVSVCVNQLPKEWEPGSNVRHTATFPVFFFKVWAYPSGYQNKFSDDSLQQSPLLIALNPVHIEATESSVNWKAIGLAGILGIGLIAIWTSYYVGQARRDRSASQFSLPSKVDSDALPNVDQKQTDHELVPGMPVIKERDES